MGKKKNKKKPASKQGTAPQEEARGAPAPAVSPAALDAAVAAGSGDAGAMGGAAAATPSAATPARAKQAPASEPPHKAPVSVGASVTPAGQPPHKAPISADASATTAQTKQTPTGKPLPKAPVPAAGSATPAPTMQAPAQTKQAPAGQPLPKAPVPAAVSATPAQTTQTKQAPAGQPPHKAPVRAAAAAVQRPGAPPGRGDPSAGAQSMAEASEKMAKVSLAEVKSSVEKTFQPAPSERFAMKTYKLRPPKRKSPGTVGTRINLITNHYDLKFTCNEVYHYDVEISERCPKRIKRRIFKQAMSNHPQYSKYKPVFDGEKNMYTARELPRLPDGAKATLTVEFCEDGGRARNYTLTVQRAQPCMVDLEPLIRYLEHGGTDDVPQSAIQALDIVLRNEASLRFTPVGRSFFPEQERVLDIGGGCELWIGFYSSIRHGWKQARVNIDVSHKAFHSELAVLDKMASIVGERNFDPRRGLQQQQHMDIDKQLRMLKIEYSRGTKGDKRRYRVNALTDRSARDSMFDADGERMSVEQYFSKKFGMQLKFPLLPCLWVGSREKNIYVPAELCTIVKGQVNTHKLGPDQVSTMIRHTAVPADVRQRRIQDFVREANLNQDPHLKEFGLHVADRPTSVTGRVLPPPTLQYQQPCTVRPRDGVWDMRQKRFLEPRNMERWCVLDYARVYPDKLKTFLAGLRDSGRQVGMNIAEPMGLMQRDGRFVERVNAVRDLGEIRKQYDNPQLVLVILPEKNKLYHAVKGAGDVEVGQLTTCVLVRTVMRADRQTATNICQKLNAKLGGANTTLGQADRPPLFQRPTIILGADVTHPPPDQPHKPSIAAVVASLDASLHARYAHRVLVQFPSGQRRAEEMILDLKTAVRELLQEFHKFNKGTKPERILFFRDGVSEGQFAQVMGYELEQVREACRSLNVNYQPKITFLVVQKRHHTRLFVSDMRQACGRSKNVPPGTVVDSVIAHPSELDYFLVSHQGIQGTSRPTHYHILHDDSQMSADELEKLTYFMCHLFTRCTRSVSNPAPSYYAHLAAYRARVHHDNYLRVNRIRDDQPVDKPAAITACNPRTTSMYYV